MESHCDEFVPVKIESSVTIKEEVLEPLATISLTEKKPKTPAQRQREYRQRMKEKATAVQKQKTKKSSAERQREYRKRQKSKQLAELFCRALREFQHVQPPEFHQSEQDESKTTECASLTIKQEIPDPLTIKQEIPDPLATSTTETSKVSSSVLLLSTVPITPRVPKSNAQRQREYRLRKAMRKIEVNKNRPPPKTCAERQRDYRQRQKQKAKESAQTSTSQELTGSSISSNVEQAESKSYTESTPTMSRVKNFFTDNNLGQACSICNKLWFDNVLTFMTADQVKIVSAWFDKENLQFRSDEFEVVCETCKYSLDEGSMPVLAKVHGFSYPEILPGLPLNPISERLLSPRMPYREVFCEPALVVQQPEYLVLSEKWMRDCGDPVPIKNYECISRLNDESDSNLKMGSGVSIYRKVSSTGDFLGDVNTAGDVCLIEIAFNTADPNFNFTLGAVYVRTATCVRDVEQLLQQALFPYKQDFHYESPFLFVDPTVPSLGYDDFETFDTEDDS